MILRVAYNDAFPPAQDTHKNESYDTYSSSRHKIDAMIYRPHAILLLSAVSTATAFVQQAQRPTSFITRLRADNNDPNVDRMKQIIQEEASDANMMKSAAEQMKNLTPDQIDSMIRDMEQMNPIQKQALKALGMDPEAMKQTMKMMKGKWE